LRDVVLENQKILRLQPGRGPTAPIPHADIQRNEIDFALELWAFCRSVRRAATRARAGGPGIDNLGVRRSDPEEDDNNGETC
jgi:hypothetical protein